MFTVSVVPFGFAPSIATLDALRFVQGAACGCIWAGATWVVALTPRERRGEVLGSVFGTVIFGTLLGPVVGTLAVGISTAAVFAAVGVVSLGLVVWTLRYAEPPRPEREPQTHVGAFLRRAKSSFASGCFWWRR